MLPLFIIEIVICGLVILVDLLFIISSTVVVLPKYRREIEAAKIAEDTETVKKITKDNNDTVGMTKVLFIILLIFVFFLVTAICAL